MKCQTISLKFFFCCERRNLLCSHSNSNLFTGENDMLFSHVQKSCFRAKAHLVSHWCLYNRTTFSSYLTSVFWWTSVILSFRPICQIYVKCVNNVICNREFFQKTLVTKVSWPKLLVTLKMMDVRQNISVILHVQLSFRIRVLQTQLKNKCRNFENEKKKNFLYCLNKLLLYYISTVKEINRQNGSGSTDLLLLRAVGLLAFSPVIIHSFFLQLSSVILQSKGLFKYSQSRRNKR